MSDEQNAPEGAEGEAPKRSMLPALLALVIGLAVGLPAGVFALGPMIVGSPTAAADSTDSGHGDDVEADSADGVVRPVHSLDNLVLNPAATNGTRFLMVSMSIEAADDAAAAALTARDPEVRDATLRLLGSKTVEQLANVAVRDSLKTEIQALLNDVLGRKAVRRVYFPQFVIQ